jgi:hypothetical protein
MKMIRQSEVYMMEEAVTQNILNQHEDTTTISQRGGDEKENNYNSQNIVS